MGLKLAVRNNGPVAAGSGCLNDDKNLRKVLLLLLVFMGFNGAAVYAQTGTRQVRGTVTDEQGAFLSGATVHVIRTNLHQVTDESGTFTIDAAKGDALEFSYIGKATKSVVYNNEPVLNVVLQDDGKDKLEEVVVSTGYQNVNKKMFTGSSAIISAKDALRNGIPDVSRMLEGQAAGVSVQNVSGTFGAAPKIQIRGATSLSGDNKPLFVIDGIMLQDVVNISNEALTTGDANTLIGSSVAGLNPDDIETITILKDAAATSMYGARAMNGVVVITTKKGRNTQGRAAINYTGNFTTFLKPSYSQFDIMNSAEQMSVMLELENKGYFNHSQVSRAATGGVFYKMYNLMYDYDEATNTFALKNTLQDRLNFLERYARANTDWFDVLFKNSLMQEHSVSVMMGTDKAQSYFSTSFLNDNGQTIGDRVKRYTANFRTTMKVNERLNIEFGANGSIRDQRAPGTLTRASDPVYGQYSRDFDINPYSYAINTSRLITPYDENGGLEFFTRNYAPFNIINELDKNYLELGVQDLQVRAGIKYKILSGLVYSFDASYRYAVTKRRHYVKEGSNMAEAFRANGDASIADGNRNLYTDPDDPNSLPVVVLPEGGFYNTNDNDLKHFYVRNALDYDRQLGDDHRIKLYGMVEASSLERQYSNFTGVAYQYENGGLVNPNYRFFKKMIEGGDAYFGMNYGFERLAAFAFKPAYSFKERYIFNGSIRYDGSNKMGKSKVARWQPTWNTSLAWDIDREDFFNPDNKILSTARLRATYGLVGNMGNATNSSAVYYNRITYRPYENEKEAGTYISSLENSELTWEKLYEFNLGTDLSFFRNKVNLTVDVYKRNIFDLIGPIRTSGIGGEFTKSANYGAMSSKGLEVTLGGNPVSKPDGFKWRTQFNFGLNKNKITKLEVDPNIWTMVRAEGGTKKGYPQRGLFSIQFDGLDPDYGYPTYIGTDGKKDTYVYLQSTDIDYLKYHGPVDPTFTGGFFNRVAYKGLSLSALFTFAAGNYIRLQPTYTAVYNDMVSMSEDVVNRWIMPGDETRTGIPSLLDQFAINNSILKADGTTVSAVYPYNAYNYSDQRVAKGDFIRLKNVTLAYLLPRRMVTGIGLQSLQLAVVGNNIALLYSDKRLNGADPEFFNNGGVAMPIPKQYTFSIKAGF
ncbi:SusC/RagA family TonB-linked outer membrane protein [Niabella aurantiaca]|uniref:SusC/RagA family TonB-linked outer membrane protein n=1 Tax=Niabella aurantiaca TaxID=379900 RepID=UPI00036BBA72|nr:SusC/RagA family TonB-linked outer membrane protein [Niabella aurantiaca]